MIKDETNNKYGNLIVLKRVENDKYGNAKWLCKCDCGKTKITKGSTLRNGACISCGCKNGGDYNLLRSGDAPYKGILNTYKAGAKSRKLEFNLTLDFIKKITSENCVYCGKVPSLKKYAYHKTRYTKGIETDEFIIINGIDRVDNKKGYIESNCVPCCYTCNSMKSNHTKEEFIKNIIKVIKHLNIKI